MPFTNDEGTTDGITGSLENPNINDKSEKKKKMQKKKRFDHKDEKKCRQLFLDMNSAKTRGKIRASCQALHDQYTKNPFDYESFKTAYAAFIAGDLQTFGPENVVEPKHCIEPPTNSFVPANSAFSHLKTVDKKEKVRFERYDRMKHEAQLKIPDAFERRSQMLYIRVLVNGEPTIAFIDSGCSTSIIGLSFAKKANLENTIDRRFREIIFGAGGSDKFVGQIHSCDMKIGSISIKAKLRVLIDEFDILIGLDILRLFRGFIDLQYDRLSIQDLQSFKVHTKFLSIDEIDKWEKEYNFDYHLRDKKVAEEKLSELIEMGYDKQDAEKALKEYANDLLDAVCCLYKRALNTQKLKGHNNKMDETFMNRNSTENDINISDVNASNDTQMYVNWRPLHDLYIKKPSDYESFKHEYAKLVEAQKKTEKILNNSASEVGKIMEHWKSRMDNWNVLRAQSANLVPLSIRQKGHLYIKINVNGISTIAFVDSGAETCSMSIFFAKKAGLEDMIDPRARRTFRGFGGTAQDVGTIYSCPFKIGNAKFEAIFSVANSYDDLLIGLDFLRRHNCVIDLEGNRLFINESRHVEFVSEEEVKKWRNGREMYVHHKFKLDETKLKELTRMGFKKKDAELALTDSANDLNIAVETLYYKANSEFVKTASKKNRNFAEIINPMGIIFE